MSDESTTSVRRWAVRVGVGAIVFLGLSAGVFFAWPGAVQGWFDRHLLQCPEIRPSARGEVQAPMFCEDPTSVAYENRAAFRDSLNAYAESLRLVDDATGSSPKQLVAINGSVNGDVIPMLGADSLNFYDLARRGRIVARIKTSRAYAHGLARGVSYIWVDYLPRRKWRVVVIPVDPSLPMSVLSDYRVDPAQSKNASRTPHGSVHLVEKPTPESLKAWEETLSDDVTKCRDDKRKACWVRPRFPAPDKQSTSSEDLEYDDGVPTDAWVLVTGQGCVCVGTKCHNYKKNQPSGGGDTH